MFRPRDGERNEEGLHLRGRASVAGRRGFEVRKEHTFPVHFPVQALLELEAEDMQVYAVEAPPDPLAREG